MIKQILDKMDPKKEPVCSLCFSGLGSSEKILIDGDLLELLTFLISKIDIDALENSPICEVCSEKVQEACIFKMAYSENSNKTVNDTDVEIKSSSERFNKCEICKNIVEKSASFFNFILKHKDTISYLDQKLNSKSFENSHICELCQESLDRFENTVQLLSVYDKNRNDENVFHIHHDNSASKKKIVIKEDSLTYDTNLNEQIQNVEINGITLQPTSKNSVDQDIKVELIEEESDCEIPEGIIIKEETIEETVTTNIGSKETDNSVYEDFMCTNEELVLKEEYPDDTELECTGTDENSLPNKENDSNNRTEPAVNKISKFIEKCPFCDFQSKCRNYLKKHVFKMHLNMPPEIKTYKCSVCPFETQHKYYMKGHMVTHGNYKKFKCFNCSFQTKHKHSIRQHLINNRKKDYRCRYCTYTTRFKCQLYEHNITHSKRNKKK